MAFWATKVLTTGMGESASDYLVHRMPPVVAVALGAVAFTCALITQLRARRYVPWIYWLAVAMVGIFGTMAADVIHVGFGVLAASQDEDVGVTVAVDLSERRRPRPWVRGGAFVVMLTV